MYSSLVVKAQWWSRRSAPYCACTGKVGFLLPVPWFLHSLSLQSCRDQGTMMVSLVRFLPAFKDKFGFCLLPGFHTYPLPRAVRTKALKWYPWHSSSLPFRTSFHILSTNDCYFLDAIVQILEFLFGWLIMW